MQHKEILEVAARLRTQYGEILTLEETANAIRKSQGMLKITLNSPARRGKLWVQRLLDGRVRLGRRVYFRPEAIASVIVLGDMVGDEL